MSDLNDQFSKADAEATFACNCGCMVLFVLLASICAGWVLARLVKAFIG